MPSLGPDRRDDGYPAQPPVRASPRSTAASTSTANALEFIGVAPLGAGSALSPVDIDGGVAFAAYGLKPVRGSNAIRLVVVPGVAGRIQLNVVIDAAAAPAARG